MSESSEEYSEGSAPNEEDLKMQKLLAEWDEKDAAQEEYVDSDEDEEDEDAVAKKKALLRKNKNDESDSEEEAEESSEEEISNEGSDNAEEEEEETSDEEYVDEEGAQEEDEEEEEEEEEEALENEEEEEEEEPEPESEPEPEPEPEPESEPEPEPEPVKKEKHKKDKKKHDSEPIARSAPPDVDDDDEDDDDVPIVDKLKKKPKKKKAKKPSKKLTDPDEEDDPEDAKMKAMLANWNAETGATDDDDEEEEAAAAASDTEASAVSEREVELDDNVIDHIVLAAPDLEEAMAEFEKKTSIPLVIAGTIKGLGIKCARISFADATYLEVIAPDPKGPGPIGELIKSKNIKELTPFHFAIRTQKAEELKSDVSKLGYTPDHITMFGSKSDGTPRKWEMLYLYGHKMGGVCPFFINWANSDHPCATLPIVGKLKKVVIRAPADDPVHKLLDQVGVEGLTVEVGKKKFSMSFKSPEGTIKFASDNPVGFKFPGFEADVGAIPGDEGDQDVDVVFEDHKMPDLLPVADTEYDELPPPAY